MHTAYCLKYYWNHFEKENTVKYNMCRASLSYYNEDITVMKSLSGRVLAHCYGKSASTTEWLVPLSLLVHLQPFVQL